MMTVRELVERLQAFDPNDRVVYRYDDIHSDISFVSEEDEMEWRNNPPPIHRSRSLLPTGSKIVILD